MSVVVPDPVAERVQKWVGTLPAEWTGARLLEVADAWTSNVDKHAVEHQPPVRLCNYVDVYKNKSIDDSLNFMAATATREQIRKFRIRIGDTLITKDSETAYDIGIPAFVEYEADDLVCGYHLAIIRPDARRIAPRFLYWVLDSQPIARQWSVTAAGVTRVGIRSTDLNKVTIPLPPLEEQRAIAKFLDQETAQIDALVAKQEEFIDLLRERRAGLIFRAVTRGLRTDISLQPSTLSWAAEVPEPWRVTNIRRVAEMRTGHTPSRSTPEYWENASIPWFTLADVWQLRDGTRTYLGDTSGRISPLGLKNSAAELLPAGTVVLSRTASVGFSGIMPTPMATSQDFWNWVCGPDLLPEYLLQVFRAMRQEFNLMMTGSTHKTIYQPTAAAIRIPLPPVDEQREIVTYIDEQISHIDALIAKAQEHIALAKERRETLVTAAVTGKFDILTSRKAG